MWPSTKVHMLSVSRKTKKSQLTTLRENNHSSTVQFISYRATDSQEKHEIAVIELKATISNTVRPGCN